jgi:CheY-like chemotaxis protein
MPDNQLQPVLYVEDEENDVMLVRLGFNRAGIEHPLHVVTDGKQAVDYLFSHGAVERTRPLPCLVLLDLNLPQLSGFEVLERIRQEQHFKDLPVVILSSSEQPPDQERARQLGANQYFVKPASLDRIIEMAHELKQRWLIPCSSPVPAELADQPGL